MEEKETHTGTGSDHLSEKEKDVLDEFILDLKNNGAIIPLHEENNRTSYVRKYGITSFLNLLRTNIEYIRSNGDFNQEQTSRLDDFLSK
jgi:hypothetical protein